jgi:heme/copper-type cytochrome/quinol oxidase subunit 1
MLIFYKIINAYSGSRAEYLLTKAIKTKTYYVREVESVMTNVSVNFFSTPSWASAPKVDFFKDSKKRPVKMSNSVYYKSFTWKMKESSELYKKLFWIKSRIMYFANNWIYTTNHKRIAINYFFFVLFSGTCGMALATIIRLEMAYPGVGILAGDSLQYLSIVTAHAVIMVFFMIMPLLLGAYSNFLLPTQLGVHDVAFPRLNSAAFWFLPAGLIMLAQLVCLDRRYQRMNCFNMRELQALLKEKYFNDIVNNYDYRSNIFNSLNLKYKLNDLSVVDNNLPLFNNNSLKLTFFTKLQNFNTVNNTDLVFTNFNYFIIMNYNFIQDFSSSLTLYVKNLLTSWLMTPDVRNILEISLDNTFGLIVDFFHTFLFNTHYAITHLYSNIKILALQLLNNNQLVVNFYFQIILNDFIFNNKLYRIYQYLLEIKSKFINNTWSSNNVSLATKTEHKNVLNDLTTFNNTIGESVEDSKALRFNNPIFKYDYKLGNYLSKETINNFPHLMLSQTQVTGGIRKASYLYSTHFIELFTTNLNNYLTLFTNSTTVPAFIEPELRHASSTNSFYNLFLNYNTQTDFINTHWTLNNTLNQKFYKIFLTSSMQQRVYSNWRQLKFSREAWRCKLLAARHQKTLYHRYVNEDGVFWSVERNAKDVLPGWAMITPFSARTRFTAIGKVDIGLMGVFIVINSSIVSSANFLVTYRYLSTLNNKKRRDARSFYTEGIIVASWMMIAANPMLAIGILMLLSDRHWQTSFFDYSGGGDTVLFQHMFWFFGHPEVYIIMIPAFGFVNTILSFYLRKRVSARASLLYSMYTIAFLGFFVWGHHMYMVGLAHTTRMLFSTLTVMISVPAATKLMHWCVTLVNSSIQVELPLLYAFLFVFFFVSGGISGMAVAHTGMDVLFHDTFYVVGHFHVMLAGAAMFGAFGGLYFYFPAIFGVKFSRTYAYIHLVYYLLGQLMTVIPMFWLGYSGMPRRVLDYPAALGGWHAVASAGHLLSVAGMVAFFVMIFDSLRQGRAATRNSFGISRFNTRLNFYLYETSKMLFIQHKCWYISRHESMKSVLDERKNLLNHELSETSAYSYVLIRVQ